MKKQALILGAGPAGLTAGYELLRQTDIVPVLLETDSGVGGLCRTIDYRGNKLDIGVHRFYSTNPDIINWWLSILPESTGADDAGMLKHPRRSRIYFGRHFFDYPLSLDFRLLAAIGPAAGSRIIASYCYSRLFPRKPVLTMEDFLVNRFGRQLYELFFRDYTRKVWGRDCRNLSPDTGEHRIKDMSFWKALVDSIVKPAEAGAASLSKYFYYPKLGAGYFWEQVGERIKNLGGIIKNQTQVIRITHEQNRAGARPCRVLAVETRDCRTGETAVHRADYVISSLPLADLVRCLEPQPPAEIAAIARGLPYRALVTVGILLEPGGLSLGNGKIAEHWLYLQNNDIKLARISFYHNWSDRLAVDPAGRWLGLEFFCDEGDEFWNRPDHGIVDQAMRELEQIGVTKRSAFQGAVVARDAKAYPVYSGTYASLPELRHYLDSFSNLLVIGRNGMHAYSSQEQAILTAQAAVACLRGQGSRQIIWDIKS